MAAKVFPGVRMQAAVSGVYTTCTTARVGVQVRGVSLGSSFLGPVSLTSAIGLTVRQIEMQLAPGSSTLALFMLTE